MKIFVVIEGEFNEASSVLGLYSTRENALMQVEKAKKGYFIKDVEWIKREYDTWIYGWDYITIVVYELDEYAEVH